MFNDLTNKMKWIFLLIAIIGISSRFVNIGAMSIQIDETWVVPTYNFHFGEQSIYPKLFSYPEYLSLGEKSQKVIKYFYDLHPVFQIIAIRAVSDVHPPLFFINDYYWGELFGYDIWKMRTPAAIYFIVTLFLLFYILKRQNVKPIVTATILSAVVLCPIYLFFSNFARPYTLLLLLSLLSSYLSFLLIANNFKKSTVFYYIIAAVACLYTHYYATLVIASQFIYFLMESYLSKKVKANFKTILIMAIIILVLFLPWAFVILLQSIYRYPGIKKGFSELGLRTILDVILSFSYGYSRSSLYSSLNIAVCLVQVVLFVKGIIYLINKRNQGFSRFWLFFFFSPLIMIIILNIIQPVFTARNCSIILIPYLAICCFGLCSLNNVFFRGAVSMFVGSIGLVFIFYSMSYGDVKGKTALEDWKSTAGFIQKLESNIPVYVYHPAYLDALYYYIPDSNRIKALSEEMWENGPAVPVFILVDVNPQDKTQAREVVKEALLLKSSDLDVRMIGEFPHIKLYQIMRK
jgi:uncharacterized membrane protein